MSSSTRAAAIAAALLSLSAISATARATAPCYGPPATCNVTQHVPLAYPGKLQIFNLYWHPNWDSLPGHEGFQIQAIDHATAALVDSDYFDALSQYGVKGFTFGGSTNTNLLFLPCPKTPGGTETVGTLAWFIGCAEASALGKVPTQLALPSLGCSLCGSAPAPAACYADPGCSLTPNATGTVLYNVFLPVGTKLNDAGGSYVSCRDYGAFHAQIPSWQIGGVTPGTGGRPLYFTLIPVECASGSFDTLMESLTHEMVEAATDPLPLTAWFDTSTSPTLGTLALDNVVKLAKEGEVADICQPLARTLTPTDGSQEFRVSAYWSNADNSCMAMGPVSPAPPPTHGSCHASGSSTAPLGVPAALGLALFLTTVALQRRARRARARAA
jgi:hypothetical protein